MRVAKPFEGSAISELAVCLQESSSTEVERLMQGTISGRRVLVFNLRAYSSLGEGATVTTFAAFQSSASRRPVFQIRAKNIIDRCWGTLVRNAVDRDIDPVFAKRFLLCCADDAEKHEFFTRGKLLHLHQCAGPKASTWSITRPATRSSALPVRHTVKIQPKRTFAISSSGTLPKPFLGEWRPDFDRHRESPPPEALQVSKISMLLKEIELHSCILNS